MSSVYMHAESGDEITVRLQPRRAAPFEVRIGDTGVWLFLARDQAEQLHAALGRALAAGPDEGGAS